MIARVQSNEAQVQQLYTDRLSTRRLRVTDVDDEVKKLAREAGLVPKAISYPEEEIQEYNLIRRSFNFSVQGTYAGLRKFVNLLEASHSFLSVDEASVANSSDGPELRIDLSLSTLFARDDQDDRRRRPPRPPPPPEDRQGHAMSNSRQKNLLILLGLVLLVAAWKFVGPVLGFGGDDEVVAPAAARRPATDSEGDEVSPRPGARRAAATHTGAHPGDHVEVLRLADLDRAPRTSTPGRNPWSFVDPPPPPPPPPPKPYVPTAAELAEAERLRRLQEEQPRACRRSRLRSRSRPSSNCSTWAASARPTRRSPCSATARRRSSSRKVKRSTASSSWPASATNPWTFVS